MKSLQITGSLRTETGKKMAKRIRREAMLPAIIYGGKENVKITVVERDLTDVIYTPDVHLVEIGVGKKKYNTIIKEMQFHPVSDKVLHVDFLEIFDDKKVTIAIPIKLTGSSAGVKAGGKLSLITRKLKVSGFPKDLPDTLKVDITNLELGKSLLAEEIDLGNLELIDPKTSVIASVKLTRAARGAALDEEGAEGAPEAGAPASAEGGEAAPEAKTEE